MLKIKPWILPFSFLLLAGCASAPYTGRSQFILVPESQEVSLGEEAYRQILRDSVISRHPGALRILRKVGERIARVADKSNYKWEFNVIDDPEMANAFVVPGGKVAVYTGIFPVARDEEGLAVILGHEVAHALARHAAERMSQDRLIQLVGAGLSVAGSNPRVMAALGLGASVGIILPFGRSQELEADRVGLILMAKAGYDPRAALKVWERMRKQEKGGKRGSPPEFFSTHPGYESRTQKLRSWIPEALKFYRPSGRTTDLLPSPESLDSPTARAERRLMKAIGAVNQKAGDTRGQRAVVEALGHTLRRSTSFLVREMQELRLGYGQYAALRGVADIGRVSLRRVFADYERGASWTDLSKRHGIRMTELLSFMRRLLRTIGVVQGKSPYRSSSQRPRTPYTGG
jgi:predicted Zn-dependent protease